MDKFEFENELFFIAPKEEPKEEPKEYFYDFLCGYTGTYTYNTHLDWIVTSTTGSTEFNMVTIDNTVLSNTHCITSRSNLDDGFIIQFGDLKYRLTLGDNDNLITEKINE